jgi:hypothetical protein
MRLACGSIEMLAQLVAEEVAPCLLHSSDVQAIAEELAKIQDSLQCTSRYSVTMWDADWPHKFWAFSKEYRHFNRLEDDPAVANYTHPILQISVGRRDRELPSNMIQYKLRWPVSK